MQQGKSAERIARNSFAELFETKGQLVASPVHLRVGTMTFTLRAGNTTFLTITSKKMLVQLQLKVIAYRVFSLGPVGLR